jgi:hypothetical protein
MGEDQRASVPPAPPPPSHAAASAHAEAPRPAGTSEPFAVTLSGQGSPPPGSRPINTTPVADDLVWAVAALAVLAAGLAFTVHPRHAVVLVPLLFAVQVALLVADRVAIPRSGSTPPGWLWVVLPPAYLFRRARALGRRPMQAYVFVAVGVVARLAIGVFGLGPGAMVDTGSLAALLNERHEQVYALAASTSCDRWVALEPGTTFACTTRFENDGTYRIEFEILNERGELRQGRTSLRNVSSSSG